MIKTINKGDIYPPSEEWLQVNNALTIAEAERIYHVCRSTLNNDMNKARVAFNVVGGVILVSRSSLNRLYRKRQAKYR